MRKAPILSWWSAAKGKGDDLTYYKKAEKAVRIIKVLYIVFGILIAFVKVIAVFGILMISVKAITRLLCQMLFGLL